MVVFRILPLAAAPAWRSARGLTQDRRESIVVSAADCVRVVVLFAAATGRDLVSCAWVDLGEVVENQLVSTIGAETVLQLATEGGVGVSTCHVLQG